jgi:hypothetical protein
MDIRERWQPPADKPGGRVNILPNPSFENDLNGWQENGGIVGATFTRDTVYFTKGGASVRIAGTIDQAVTRFPGLTNLNAPFTLRPGQQVAFRFDYKVTTVLPNRTGGQALIRCAKADGTTVDVATTTFAPSVGTGSVTSAVATVPAGVVRAWLVIYQSSATLGDPFDFSIDSVAVMLDGLAAVAADGDDAGYRWEAAPHASRSIELAESKLAEYTLGVGATGPAFRVDRDGLHTLPTGASQSIVVHTGRGYLLDDVEVAARYRIDSLAAGNVSDYLGTPGIGYRPDDPRYLWAAVEGTTLKIYYYNGTTNVLVASGGTVPALVVGREYTVVIRAVGDVLEAELWGNNAEPKRGNQSGIIAAITTRLTEATNPRASDMGSGRRGYAMARSWVGPVGATSTVTAFRVQPYSAARQTGPAGPAVIDLADIPGNAPARVDVEVDGSGFESPFGLIAWRRRRRQGNLAANGDFGSSITGNVFTSSLAGGAITGAGATAARIANAAAGGAIGPGDGMALQIVSAPGAPAPANSGAELRIYNRFRRGRVYTVDFWALVVSGAWELVARFDTLTTDQLNPAITATSWAHFTLTTTALSAERYRLDLAFRHPGTNASEDLRVANVRVWEGTAADEPPARSAQPPFGQVDAHQAIALTGFADAAAVGANSPSGRALSIDMTTIAAGQFSIPIDPRLLDLGDDDVSGTVDVEVYGYGYHPTTATSLDVALGLNLEYGDGSSIQYARPWGQAGKRLVTPSPTSRERVWKLGTLTITRGSLETGRLILTVFATSNGGVVAPGIGGIVQFYYLMLVPVRARASSPTALPQDSTYPDFLPGTTYSSIRRFLSDLRALIDVRPGGFTGAAFQRVQRAVGLAGANIELEPGGPNELLVWANRANVPDDPNGAIGGPTIDDQVGVHAAVTPRYRLMRDD